EGCRGTAVSESSSATDADSNAVGLFVFCSGSDSEAERISLLPFFFLFFLPLLPFFFLFFLFSLPLLPLFPSHTTNYADHVKCRSTRRAT
ncbi:MAG: hypothetical protein R3Y11_12540, partial [Pseudomonadota bacterium]